MNTHSTNATAPACITYSQPPPSSGSLADVGFSPTIFSYSCGPTQTTHIYLATATNAPASASPSPSPNTVNKLTHLPIYAYVAIGIGGVLVLLILGFVSKKYSRVPNQPRSSPYQCRHCGSTNLKFGTVERGNPLGNDGRPYYVCVNRYCPNVNNSTHHYRGWVTWDDNVGIQPQNPLCRCLRNAREDVAGVRSHSPGHHFWTCSRGACDFYRRVPGT